MINKDSYIAMQLLSPGYAQTSSDDTLTFHEQSAFSIEAWVKPEDFYRKFSILKKNNTIEFYLEKGLPVLTLGGITAAGKPIDGKITVSGWNHIFISYSYGRIDFYVNGIHCGMANIRCGVNANRNLFLMGENSLGMIRTVRLFNEALDASAVFSLMYGETPESCVADFDFSKIPASDIKNPDGRKIEFKDNAKMVIAYPALLFSETSYASPTQSEGINPGGLQLDSYTVQTTVVITYAEKYQMLYCNGSLEDDTGIAVYMKYDDAKSGFYVCSLRGSVTDENNILYSESVVKLDEWVNIAVRFNGIEHAIFIDGKKDAYKNVGPIARSRNRGQSLIGACLESERTAGSKTLQGYMSFITLWSLALPDSDIESYITETEDPQAEGLSAFYDFNNIPVRNMIDGSPVALIDMANVYEKVETLTSEKSEMLRTEQSDKKSSRGQCQSNLIQYTISAKLMAEFRSKVDFNKIKSHCKDGQMNTGQIYNELSGIASPLLSESEFNKCMSDIAPHIHVPLFCVTCHKVEGDDVWIVHLEEYSYVAYRGNMEITDCAKWRIRLLFIIVSGVLMAITGLKFSLTDRALTIFEKILAAPAITTALATGSSMTAVTLFGIFKEIYNLGVLKELVIAMLGCIGFWTIVCLFANLLQWLTGSKLAGLLVILAGTVAAFVYEYSQKPSDCDPPKPYRLSGIMFYTGGAGSSVRLRKNYECDIQPPEWTSARITTPAIYQVNNYLPTHSLPAAYTQAQLQGQNIVIFVKVDSQNPAKIRVKATGGGILGNIDSFTVTPGMYNQVPLSHSQWADVRRNEITFNWQYSTDDGATWSALGSSTHIIYSILSIPTAPWRQGLNTALWADALDFACQWAEGSVTAEAAAGAITRVFHEDSFAPLNTKLYYTPSRRYLTGDTSIELGKFLQCMKTANTPQIQRETVNCSSCANLVMVLSNALGCNLKVGRIQKTGKDNFHHTNIKSITNVTTHPWTAPDNFSYHDIAFLNTVSTESYVYDACLKLDGTDNPWQARTANAGNASLLPGYNQMRFKNANDPLNLTAPYIATDSYLMRILHNADGNGQYIDERNSITLTQMNLNIISGVFVLLNVPIGQFMLSSRCVLPADSGNVLYLLHETYILTAKPEVFFEVRIKKTTSHSAAKMSIASLQEKYEHEQPVKPEFTSCFTKASLAFLLICPNAEYKEAIPVLTKELLAVTETAW